MDSMKYELTTEQIAQGLKIVDSFLWDKNDNRWDLNIYASLDEALEASKSLVNCKNCINCDDCTNCIYCENCDGCRDCKNCRNCVICQKCVWCDNCQEFQNHAHCNYNEAS